MNVSVKSRKTGRFYSITLKGNDHRLVLRMHTLLGLTGSLFALSAMSLFATMTAGRPYSQEIFFAFAIGTLIAGKRALTLYREVKKMLDMIVIKHESQHPN
jgi:hypothetical protein